MLWHSRRATCTNKLTISRHEVEERVLSALQDKLMRKDFFEAFCREFAKEMNRLRMEQRARHVPSSLRRRPA